MNKVVTCFSRFISNAFSITFMVILLCGTGYSREAPFPDSLSGTEHLQLPENIYERLHRQIDDYFLRRIKATPSLRDELWRPDFSSPEDYSRSLEQHRLSLRSMLGLQKFPQTSRNFLLHKGSATVEEIEIRLDSDYIVRALLFVPPVSTPAPAVIALGPADEMREEFTGLVDSQDPADWMTELLGQGIAVAVPTLVRRSYDHPWSDLSWGESMDRRRFLYRLAFVVGRTMPGLEVQQVLALKRQLAQDHRLDSGAIGVMGIGQGGMTAFYAAAVDSDISAAAVVDYFDQRENVWEEPVDRTLWGHLNEFGDAQVAALIAPRPLSVFTSESGSISQRSVAVEADRARRYYRGLNQLNHFQVRASDQSLRAAAREMAHILGRSAEPRSIELPRFPREQAVRVDQQQFHELHRYLRSLIAQSEQIRTNYWELTKVSDDNRRAAVADLKRELQRLMGAVSNEGIPLNPRTSLIEVNESFAAYDVLLDVAPGLEAWGQLLIPREVRGRAPAVITQHGGGGTPAMVTGIGFQEDSPYHAFAGRLAQRGYVVFAPMVAVANLPFPEAEDRMEAIRLGLTQAVNPKVRMAAALGMMRTSIEQARLERIVNFLQTLDFVDGERVGYYGLSYGGYSATWMTALEPRIRASVISGHFNDWEPKITSHRIATSYLRHPDEDFTNWNVLHRFSHLELIAAMWPTAVCIEYGERDAVTPPGWFRRAWRGVEEYASAWQVQDRIELVYFDGGHEIHGIQTLDFLDRWLRPDDPAGRDYVEDVFPPPSSETELEAVRITRHLDSRTGSRLVGSFYVAPNSPVLEGLKFRISRRGHPGDLILRIGSEDDRSDIATVRIPSDQIFETPESWVEVPVGPVRLNPDETYHYELTAEWGWTDSGDDYVLYGPRPLGGSCPAEHFGISFSVMATGN